MPQQTSKRDCPDRTLPRVLERVQRVPRPQRSAKLCEHAIPNPSDLFSSCTAMYTQALICAPPPARAARPAPSFPPYIFVSALCGLLFFLKFF